MYVYTFIFMYVYTVESVYNDTQGTIVITGRRLNRISFLLTEDQNVRRYNGIYYLNK